MPQPIRIQTMPVMMSVKRSVKPCGENQAAGSTVPIQPAISAAVEVTMKDSLKPTPVRVTTPMTMPTVRSEEHTSELQSLMRISYAVFCLKKKNKTTTHTQ